MKFKPWIASLISCSLLLSTQMFAGQDIVIGAYDPGPAMQGQTSHIDKSIEQQTANQLFHRANDPIDGNPNGKITLVQFYDYQCSHCQRMVPVINELVRANSNLRIVYKEFPILGPLSTYASKAALAAKRQGKFLPFHEALMAMGGDLSADAIFKTAKTLGLDDAKFKSDMNSDSVNQQLQANMQLGGVLRIFGTPDFYLGRTNGAPMNVINGEVSKQALQNIIIQLN